MQDYSVQSNKLRMINLRMLRDRQTILISQSQGMREGNKLANDSAFDSAEDLVDSIKENQEEIRSFLSDYPFIKKFMRVEEKVKNNNENSTSTVNKENLIENSFLMLLTLACFCVMNLLYIFTARDIEASGKNLQSINTILDNGFVS